jgi:hypothetical protein
MRVTLYLTPAELDLVRGLSITHSHQIAGDLRSRNDLTPEGRDRYLQQLDTVLGLLRAIRQAEGVCAT